jgi:hypothetical protein
MSLDYEIWRAGPTSPAIRAALELLYVAWRSNEPLSTERLSFALARRRGLDPAAADRAARAVMDNGRNPWALRDGHGRLRPTLAAALALADLSVVQGDLADVERVVAWLNDRYDPDHLTFRLQDLADSCGWDLDRARVAYELCTSDGAQAELLTIDRRAFHWITFERYLRDCVPLPAPAAPVDVPLPIEARIRQIRWSGIGSFTRPASLDLGGLTVLVGANGTGKTSALAAFLGLNQLARGDLSVSRARRDADELVLAVVADLQRPTELEVAPTRVEWQVVINLTARPHVRHESFTSGGVEVARFVRGTGWWEFASGHREEQVLAPGHLALVAASDPSTQWSALALRQALARWHVELTASAPARPLVLPVGAAARAQFETALAEVAGVRVADFGEGMAIDDGHGPVRYDWAPMGLRRVVELLAIVFAPSPPPLVAIDELELHMHADLVERLVAVLRSVSHRTQFIVTTHSARVLRLASADEVHLVHRAPHGSAVAPLTAYPHLRSLAERGALGELIEGGYFAGPP